MMRVGAYEWQYGIGVPKGEVARSAAEAETIAKHIGMEQPLEGMRHEQLLSRYRW